MLFRFPLLLAFSFTPLQLQAQSLSEFDVLSIERLANVICRGLEDSGSSSNVSISEEAASEARAILRVLVGPDSDESVEGIISNYENVPREELASQLSEDRACRLEVFRTLTGQVSVALQSEDTQQNDRLIWTFPHVIRDNIALGVINAKPEGNSGVNVNYRLRNLRGNDIYVKFFGMSYTDRNGNVCQKGSFTTGVTGIAWRSSHDPDVLPSGDSIQFSGDNIRCDASGFSDGGDVIATMLLGDEEGSMSELRFEIPDVQMLE